MEEHNFSDISSTVENYEKIFKNNEFIDDIMWQKKVNESDKYKEDERAENIEDAIKGLDYFSLYQKDDDFDEAKTHYISVKKNEQKFTIQKIMHKKIIKKGRKNSKESTLFKSKHDKNSSDNMRKKIKRQFIKSTMNYINKLYIKYLPQRNKKHEKLINKIIPNFCNSSKKEDNEKYLSMTLRELFSSDLGRKFKKINKDYNKIKIEILIKKNKQKEIIELLNKTIKETYEIYINNEIREFSLDNDLKKIEKEKGIEDANIFQDKAKILIENLNKNEK